MQKGVVKILIMGIVLVVLGAVGYWGLSQRPRVPEEIPGNNNGSGLVYCTQEAKQCPDGTWVSRVAPSCAFAACPVTPQVYTPLAALKESAALDGKVIEIQGTYTMEVISTGGLGAASPAFQTTEGILRMNNPAALSRIAPGSEVRMRGTYDHESHTLMIPVNCADCVRSIQ